MQDDTDRVVDGQWEHVTVFGGAGLDRALIVCGVEEMGAAVGRPSRWITLRVLRVLGWAGADVHRNDGLAT